MPTTPAKPHSKEERSESSDHYQDIEHLLNSKQAALLFVKPPLAPACLPDLLRMLRETLPGNIQLVLYRMEGPAIAVVKALYYQSGFTPLHAPSAEYSHSGPYRFETIQNQSGNNRVLLSLLQTLWAMLIATLRQLPWINRQQSPPSVTPPVLKQAFYIPIQWREFLNTSQLPTGIGSFFYLILIKFSPSALAELSSEDPQNFLKTLQGKIDTILATLETTGSSTPKTSASGPVSFGVFWGSTRWNY